MNRLKIALLLSLIAAPALAQSPTFPQTLPPNTVVGRLGVGAGPTEAISFTRLAAALTPTPAPYVILSTGQSNLTHIEPFTWTPSTRAQLWNFSGLDGSVGTAYSSISGSNINVAWKFASDIATANPTRKVCLINISFPGIPIDNWLSGFGGAPNVYANITNNISAALTACGATKIDRFVWWQIETSTSDAAYVTKFGQLLSRFWADTTTGSNWFPQETPVVIYGMASTAQSGDANADQANYNLILAANADPDKRKFVYTASLAAAAYWKDSLHMTGLGYFSAGALGANAALNGSSRNSLALPANNLLPNAALINSKTNVNGQDCTLGLTCSVFPQVFGNDLATNARVYPAWFGTTSGYAPLRISSTKLSFNPSSGILAATGFAGSGAGLTGTASSLTAGVASAATIQDDSVTNATMYPAWFALTSGSGPLRISSTKFSFNPSTGLLSSTGFAGSAASLVGLPLTTGVTGQLPLANGGTAANLTASNGGIFYSTASAGAILAGTATSRLPLLSGASTVPVWGAYSIPSSVTSGGIPYFSSTSAQASSGVLVTNGVVLGGGVAGSPATAAAGTNGQVFLGVTSGAPQFATMSGDGTITNAGALTITKTNGSSFASVATSGSASDLGTGTLPAGRMPALTGGCTTIAGAVATTCTINTPISLSGSNVLTFAAGGTLYIGAGITGGANTVAAFPLMLAGTVKGMTCYISTAPGVGQTQTCTLQRGVSGAAPSDTTMTCTISGTATVCATPDTTHTFSVAVNDVIDIKVVSSGAAASATNASGGIILATTSP